MHKYDADKSALLKKYDADKIILYAPTFSPSLTSAPYLFEEIKKLATNKEYLIVIKFHDLMAKDLIEKYQVLAEITNNILFVEERNIIKYLLIADLMISDTSSVVYEFLLLDKPVITFKNNSTSFDWENSLTYDFVLEKVKLNLTEDPFHKKRKVIVDQYHPYKDGNSAERMVIAVEDYITENGVPEKRNLPWLRRRKMNKMFGEF